MVSMDLGLVFEVMKAHHTNFVFLMGLKASPIVICIVLPHSWSPSRVQGGKGGGRMPVAITFLCSFCNRISEDPDSILS